MIPGGDRNLREAEEWDEVYSYAMLSSIPQAQRFPSPHSWGLILVGLLLLILPTIAPAQSQSNAETDFWGTRTAHSDTLSPDQEQYWGTIPTRHDSVTTTFTEQPRPTWENVAMTPYWVIGIPFRAAYIVTDQTVKGMDKLGLFGAPGEYPGIKGPFGSYIMPSLSIHDLEGTTLGLKVTKPRFFGEDNLLFLRASRSTQRAGAYAGGVLFNLDDVWHLEMGGGFESVNQTRFYGLGHDSRNGDLSYYYRGTTWGGFDFNRDLSPSLKMGIRAYFSQIEAHEPSYNTDQTIGVIHGGDLPYGYPGESDGWTVRWGLNRNNAEQKGRPKHGGYQSVGVSMFRATDGSDLRYLTWHANLEKFFKLWHTDRTLAVRGFANRISSLGRGDIPFTRLVTFQRPDQLRGFSSLRFYGMGSVGVSVEYRWPLWVARDRDDTGVDAYLFSDSGQVFDHTNEISLTNFQFTGGGGLRLVNANRGMGARFELGMSEEDLVVRLTFSQTFQYNPRGFLYGKNPTKVH